ncbi:nicotinate-nucleotide pyrophosphorylase [carboxylating] [Halospina denitrificans]|uniref:Probable nicotinate-nucleotide pyrophosphorylase [carboxylating] n=2 Tax=Halospina denitrificans TaxID=332522 RepID=A0A4R7JYP0_9GAMM|nr:nicotinate-nucleotide pyrophosphorylase [carboxylating] [Halospina denitrificans]
MSMIPPAVLRQAVSRDVAASIAEDEGTGDLTAALIPSDRAASATVIARHDAVVAGRPWVEETLRQIDPLLRADWHIDEGQWVTSESDPVILRLEGPARSLMTAERTVLNWLQTLSGVATRCRQYADRVAHTQARLLDTRKTLPGLRIAQKYAVTQGGCHNHRIGLYDGILIKENHIMACGSITAAVEQARKQSSRVPIEVETETAAEVAEAIEAGADIIMLDEFPLEATRDMVSRYAGRVHFEASGGVTEENLAVIAETGVDFISLGVLTKDVTAVDLSMRVTTDYMP